MNIQTQLASIQTWDSQLIDFHSIDYSKYQSVTIIVKTDRWGPELKIYIGEDNERMLLLTDPSVNDYYETTLKIVKRYLKISVVNMGMDPVNITVISTFLTENKFNLLANDNGVAISSTNPLIVAPVSNNMNVFDSVGTSISSTSHALNVYNTKPTNHAFDSVYSVLGNPYSPGWLDISNNILSVAVANNRLNTNLHASNGDNITATDNILNVNQIKLNSTTDSIQSNLFDSCGNIISSTDNKLNVNQIKSNYTTDSIQSNLFDGYNNPITSFGGGLNVNQAKLAYTTDSVKSYIYDAGNAIASTRGAFHIDDYMTSVALGQYYNMTYRKVMGYRGTVDTTGEDVTTLTNGTYNFAALPPTGISLYVNSTSANDTYGGSGGQTVDLIIQSPTSTTGTTTVSLNMNGVSNVTTSASNIRRVLGMNISSSGSNNANVGTVKLFTTGTNVEVCNIQPNQNTSQMGIYSTYGFAAFIKRVYYQCSNPCNIFIKYKPFNTSNWLILDCIYNANGSGFKDVLLNAGPLQDFKIFAVAVSTSASVGVQLDVIELP